MSFLWILILLVAMVVIALPVKLAAVAMGARRTGFGWCLLALIVASIGSLFKIVESPDEALIRYDRWHRDVPAKVVCGPGRILVLPYRHDLGTLNLSQRSIT